MPSISECRMPYLLSNLLLVTESLTLIAGNSSAPARANSYSRCTPVVVSSVTPMMSAAIRVNRGASVASAATQHVEDDVVLVRVLVARLRHGTRALELDALVDQQGGVTAVVDDHVRPTGRPAAR